MKFIILYYFLYVINSHSLPLNVQNQCNQILRDGYAMEYYGISDIEFRRLISTNLSSIAYLGPWIGSIYPNYSFRLFQQNHRDKWVTTYNGNTTNPFQFKNLQDVLKYFDNPVLPDPSICPLPATRQYDLIAQSYYSRTSDIEKSYANLKRLIRPLCAILGSFTKQCEIEVDEIIKVMHPVSNITLHKYLAKVMKEKQFYQGAILSAKKVISSSIETNQKFSVDRDVFKTIFNSYIEAGINTIQAMKNTWIINGVIATGGPNICWRLTSYLSLKNYPMWVAMCELSAAMNTIDSKYLNRPFNYLFTIPSPLSTTCENGKPYHFWMTAFLSNYLKEKYPSVNNNVHVRAAYISNLAYQLFTKTRRDTDTIFMSHSNSNSFHKRRIDIIYAALGAIYGVSYKNLNIRGTSIIQNKFDIDKEIESVLKNVPQINALSASDNNRIWKLHNGVCASLRWMRIVEPRKILNKFSHKFDKIFSTQTSTAGNPSSEDEQTGLGDLMKLCVGF